jgi:hypothetical protein
MVWSTEARRSFGLAALAFSPILFLMAAISTVQSLVFYYFQLAVFSAASSTGLVCGVSALLGLRWTTKGRVLLLAFCGLYFVAAGIFIAIFSAKGLLPPAVAASLLPVVIGGCLLFLAYRSGRSHAPR